MRLAYVQPVLSLLNSISLDQLRCNIDSHWLKMLSACLAMFSWTVQAEHSFSIFSNVQLQMIQA